MKLTREQFRTLCRVMSAEGEDGAWEHYCNVFLATPPASYVKVRIAVAIDIKGKWYATGWPGFDDSDIVHAYDGLSSDVDGQGIRYVTALIPKIETPDVRGEVEVDDGD